MAEIVNINTSSAGYTTRRNQFADIVAFWRPHLITFFQLSKEQRQAWRNADPFIDDILRFVKAVVDEREENL